MYLQFGGPSEKSQFFGILNRQKKYCVHILLSFGSVYIIETEKSRTINHNVKRTYIISNCIIWKIQIYLPYNVYIFLLLLDNKQAGVFAEIDQES